MAIASTKKKSPDRDVTSNSHMPQMGTWLSFVVRAQLSRTLLSQRECTDPKSGRFPRRELRPQHLVLPLTMATSSQLKTSRSPRPVILLRFFTFHSCGGRRSCSTLRTCCAGLQIGCSGFPRGRGKLRVSKRVRATFTIAHHAVAIWVEVAVEFQILLGSRAVTNGRALL